MAGRPSSYTEEIADTICERIANGETLREVCRDPAMPATSTVCKWVNEKPGFSERYARARELLVEHWADELLEVSDDGSNDWMERRRDDGSVIQTVDHEHISRSKLRVDSRKWLMSKLAPKRYGDKVQQEVSGPDGGPIPTQITVNFVKAGG